MNKYDTFFTGYAGGLINAVTDYVICQNNNKIILPSRGKFFFCNHVTYFGFIRGFLGATALSVGYTCTYSAYKSMTNSQLTLANKVMKATMFTLVGTTLGYCSYIAFN